MEQLIILLVIGAISLVNWLIKQSAEARERKRQQGRVDRGEEPSVLSEQKVPEESSFGPASGKEEDPSESMRKLMEALGLPLEEEPPKPVQPVRRPPPITPPELPKPAYREPERPPAPREVVADPYAQRPFVADPQRRSVRVEPEPEFAVSLESVMPASTELHDWKRSAARGLEIGQETERRNIRKLLSAQSSVRDAIILAELLGKPKALQD